MSVMHVVLISQLDDMYAKWNKPTKSNRQASPKGGEIGIPMGKTHAPKIKKCISCYKKEKTMKSFLKSNESFNKLESKHRLFLAEDFCNLRPTKAQQNANFFFWRREDKPLLWPRPRESKRWPKWTRPSLRRTQPYPRWIWPKGGSNH